jgi:hypothetical protein
MYEVTAAELVAAGHNLSQAQPDSIQMYYRGEEIPLTVEHDSLGQFVSLTFYGRRNDGALEAQMYRNPISGVPDPRQQPNANFSIYSDTAAYFLTWGRTLGKRYQTLWNTNYALYSPETSYPFESVWEPHPDSTTSTDQKSVGVVAGGGPYDSFHTLNSDFITGEGYVSENFFSIQRPFTTSFLQTPDPVLAVQDVRFQMRIFHRSNTEHHTRVTLSKNQTMVVLDTAITFNSIAINTYSRMLSTQLTSNTDLKFDALRSPTDNNHLTSIRIRYERLPDLGNQARTRISEWNRNTATYFRFANALGQNRVWAYDPENGVRYGGTIFGGDANLILDGRFYGKTVEVVTDQGFKKPLIAAKTRLLNLCHPDSGVQFVIIAHRALATSSHAYAKYRDTTLAGYEPLSAKVIFIDEIYEEFSYGAPTPQAIHQFVNCALENWTVKPKYVFLWGKGNVWMRGNDSLPIVPSYGYPANDVRFTTPWNEERQAQLAIGRLQIYNDQEGMAYLDKVKEFERIGDEPWRKDGVFVGIGRTLGELNAIENAIKFYEKCFEDSLTLKGKAMVFVDTIGAGPVAIQPKIDQGLALLYFFGINDILNPTILEALEYTNFGKYPLFMGMGAIGGEWYDRESASERWVKEPGRGAIAFLGNSSTSYLNPLRDYGRIFFCLELGPKPNRPIGEIIRLTYQKMVDSLRGVQYLNHARQMNLQGDPALAIFPFGMNTSISPPPPVGVQIYPNPVGDQLTISSVNDRIEAVSLINLHGQVILREENLFKNELQLDVSSLAPGHYFLRYKTQNGVGAEKVVVN